MKAETRCSLCGALAKYRTTTLFKRFYRCPKGHTTTILKTATELGYHEEAPPRARQTDVETSHEAAASMTEGVGAQRARILLALAAGPMTADQLDELIGWRITTAGRRLPELRKMGRVRMLEATGKTRSGRRARLWERFAAPPSPWTTSTRCSDG